jgi:hypothetical protein
MPEEPSISILATVAFEKRFYTIFKSHNVSDCREDMMRRIESILGKENVKLVGFDDTVSHMSLKSALSVTTPKTIGGRAALGEVPSFYRTVLVLMVTVIAVITGLYCFSIISLDLFATSIIMVVIALAIELGPRLKEIIDSQKSSKT